MNHNKTTKLTHDYIQDVLELFIWHKFNHKYPRPVKNDSR